MSKGFNFSSFRSSSWVSLLPYLILSQRKVKSCELWDVLWGNMERNYVHKAYACYPPKGFYCFFSHCHVFHKFMYIGNGCTPVLLLLLQATTTCSYSKWACCTLMILSVLEMTSRAVRMLVLEDVLMMRVQTDSAASSLWIELNFPEQIMHN